MVLLKANQRPHVGLEDYFNSLMPCVQRAAMAYLAPILRPFA
jgi:hypothetical protein